MDLFGAFGDFASSVGHGMHSYNGRAGHPFNTSSPPSDERTWEVLAIDTWVLNYRLSSYIFLFRLPKWLFFSTLFLVTIQFSVIRDWRLVFGVSGINPSEITRTTRSAVAIPKSRRPSHPNRSTASFFRKTRRWENRKGKIRRLRKTSRKNRKIRKPQRSDLGPIRWTRMTCAQWIFFFDPGNQMRTSFCCTILHVP